jgi:SprT protein
MNEAQRKQVLNATEAYFVKAEQIYNRKFDRVPVVFNARLTSCGGKAYYTRFGCTPVKLEYGSQFITEFTEWFVHEVTGHEVAHLVSVSLHGHAGRGHGPEWKRVMIALGLDPKRTHNKVLSSKAAKRAEFQYTCACTDAGTCSSTIYNKLLRGSVYTCRKCKTPIRAKGRNTPAPQLRQAAVAAEAPRTRIPAAPRVAVNGKAKPKSEQLRDIIRANPKANEQQIMELAKHIGIKPQLLKRYVQGNIITVRGA